MSRWTCTRCAMYLLPLTCLLPCLINAAERSEAIQQVDEEAWLVHTGNDTLIAHAVVTLPPYDADPTGNKDATRAFQEAIQDVSRRGGGLIYVPSGAYKLGRGIRVDRQKIVIQGAANAGSTVLLAYHGAGDPEGEPFIAIRGRSCGLKDLSVYYPHQRKADFVPYPYTIWSSPSVMLENLTLYNSYQGIHLGMANGTLLENIRMCTFKQGVTAKLSSEFAWARNVEISAGVSQEIPDFLEARKPDEATVRAYMKQHATGVELGALDGYLLDGLDAADCQTGLLVTKDLHFIKNHAGGIEARREGDNFGFGGLLHRIHGRIAYTGHDYYYWGIPAIQLDHVPGLPEQRTTWPVHPQASKTTAADFINVNAFGAIGDGEADDTPAVLKAIQAARSNGGGIVYFPQGSYRLTQPLQVPPGTELRGACARQEVRLSQNEVTSLLFDHDAKDPDGPASITLSNRAGVRGLNILFPHQWDNLTESAFVPTSAPCAVRGRGKGVYLVDCVITPAWKMIDFASWPCDNFMIKRVSGWGIKDGIHIGGGTRGGTIEFTQISFGFALETARNPLLQTKEVGRDQMIKLLGDYAGKHSVAYRFGDASEIDCYGLQAFHTRHHIVTYSQNNEDQTRGLRDSRFYYPLVDVALEQSLVMDAAQNVDFYGYWTTGWDRELSWVKAGNIKNVRVFGPGIHPTYDRGNYEDRVPVDQFHLIPESTSVADATIVEGNDSAKNVLDGNLQTWWQAPLKDAMFVVDLGRLMKIHRFTLVDGHLFDLDESTAIKRYRISASRNRKDWVPLQIPTRNVNNYQFANPKKFVVLDNPVEPTETRYLKVEILDVWQPFKTNGVKNRRTTVIRLFNFRATPVTTSDANTEPDIPPNR